MKHFILISMLALSIEARSATQAEQEKINGCDRYNGIFESLNKECNPEAIKVIMKKLDTPFEEKLPNGDNSTGNCKTPIEHPGKILTGLASKKFCPDALSIISNKVSDKDFAEGVNDGFAEDFLKAMVKVNEDEKSEKDKKSIKKNEEAVQKMTKTFQTIATRIVENCKKGTTESCETQKELKKLQEKLSAAVEEDCKNGNQASCNTPAKEQTDEEYLSSPEYIIDQACPIKFELERYEAILKNEKEIGKVSGAVNATTLRNTGAMIVMARKNLAEWKKAYLKKTKHEINLKNCKKSDYFSE